MGKRAKMCKALIAGLLAVTMAFTAQTGSTLKAEAAQFKGESFGVGFAGEEYATMHKADGWSNGDMFNCTWRADNVWFDGYLNLKIDRDYATGGYSGGEYRTNDTFGYGMYDVSMKAIKNDGVVTSFFTYTGPSDGTVWDEIDIEILGKDTTKVQFNYYTNGVGNHEYVYDLGFDASQSFHQYGFLWLPGRITWYVDGKEVYTATNNIPTTPGKIMMNVWPGIGVDEWLKPYNGRTPLVAQYDWINWKQVEGGSSNNGSSNNNTNNNNWNNNTNNNTGTSGGAALGTSFTIEAENYSNMSGVEKAGNCVAYIDPGDWMSYDINVANAGTYSVEFRVASAQGSSFRLEKDSGTEVLANVTVPNTGDWNAYKSVYADVYLTAGKNNIAIATDRGGFNIDKMVFAAKSGSNTNNNTGNNTNNNNTNNNNWNNNTNNNNTNNNQNNNTNTGTTGTPVGTSFTIEAENYSNMSGVEKAGNCVAYIDPGDWMSYDINVASAGTYSVEISVASAQGSSFRLEKNSGTEVLANVTVPNTGDWNAYKSVYVDVNLTAGKNTIGIATDRGGFNLDKMVFAAKSGSNTNTGNNTNNNSSNNNNTNNNTSNNQNNSANSGSTGTTSATFTVEAENFNYMSGVEKAGNCVAYIDPGDWMSYEVNVPSAGTYSVEIRVASALGSSFRLEKDSGTEVLANVTVPNTGDWNAYKSVYADVYLTAGKNNIAIATDRGGFNIDKMVFAKK